MSSQKRGRAETGKAAKAGMSVPKPQRGEFVRNLKKVVGKEREHSDSEQVPKR